MRYAPFIVDSQNRLLMRLWSLHPKYLDAKGLVALWREALLAQALLHGRTRGYRHHPQLQYFRESRASRYCIAAYLRQTHAEAARRGYRFDARKISRSGKHQPLTVSRGQLKYEWMHLVRKLRKREPARLRQFAAAGIPEPHPLFRVIAGGIADWEVVTPRRISAAAKPRKPARRILVRKKSLRRGSQRNPR